MKINCCFLFTFRQQKRIKGWTIDFKHLSIYRKGLLFPLHLVCGCCCGCVKITWQNTAPLLVRPLVRPHKKKKENEKEISQLWNGLKNAIVSKLICDGRTMMLEKPQLEWENWIQRAVNQASCKRLQFANGYFYFVWWPRSRIVWKYQQVITNSTTCPA